jgi:hypothetical protein
MANQEIYIEGDKIKNLFFIINGSASFCLPKFNCIPYIKISKGD